MSLITGLLSIPLTYFMSNDGFYFGIVPVLAEAGAAHGVGSVLVGMAKVEFGDHTRYAVKWAAATSLVVLGSGLLIGII